ncbi:MAG: response regulator [Nitrospinae bacterium]|nr:response regulator [Nitrospinota bacterium]
MSIESNMRILIVDDFSTSRRTMRMSLKTLGYHHVIEAVDGVDALAKLQDEDRIGLILLDWNMPNMSGIEFLRKVRAKPEHKKVKIIMITAESAKENIVSAMQSGVDQYLLKPVMPKNLEEKILGIVNRALKEGLELREKERVRIEASTENEEQARKDWILINRTVLQSLKEVAEIYPWKADLYFQSGTMYLEIGETGNAFREFEKTLEADPKHIEASIALADIYMKRKMGFKAVKCLTKLSGVKFSSSLYQKLGEAYTLAGDSNKAIKAFNDSIRFGEDEHRSKEEMAKKHNGLGQAFLQKHEETKDASWQEKSINTLKKSVEYDPQYISAHFNLLNVYKQTGDTEKVNEMLKKTAEITPNDSAGWIDLGRLFLENKESQKANFAFKMAIKGSKALADDYFEVGDVLSHFDLDQALKFLEKSLELDPIQSHVLNKIGMLYRKKKMLSKTLEYYEKAIALDPEEETLLYNLACAYLESKNSDSKEKAREKLEKALEISPDFMEAKNLLSKLT